MVALLQPQQPQLQRQDLQAPVPPAAAGENVALQPAWHDQGQQNHLPPSMGALPCAPPCAASPVPDAAAPAALDGQPQREPAAQPAFVQQPQRQQEEQQQQQHFGENQPQQVEFRSEPPVPRELEQAAFAGQLHPCPHIAPVGAMCGLMRHPTVRQMQIPDWLTDDAEWLDKHDNRACSSGEALSRKVARCLCSSKRKKRT